MPQAWVAEDAGDVGKEGEFYVWKEEEQWEPLWNDVRRVVELRLAEPYSAARHFLGAVVLQAHEAQTQRFTTWNVIDGQQRLTTLQLLADATQAAFTAGLGGTQASYTHALAAVTVDLGAGNNSLKLANGDLVEISVGERKIVGPTWSWICTSAM